MKKVVLFLLLMFFNLEIYSLDFVFPPELKWWLDEIQKVDNSVSLDKFKFSSERFILGFDEPISYKNKLYPVLKKWNFYGDQFAYNNISASLKKEKSGKYSFSEDIDSQFGIFDRNETLLFIDFFGSSKWIDSFYWIRDNRIIAVGRSIDTNSVDFVIYDYFLKDAGNIIVKEYTYNLKNANLSNLKLHWTSQRSDYFE